MRTSRGRGWRLALYLVIVAAAVPFLYPTWWMFTSSISPISEILAFPPHLVPAHPSFGGYVDAFRLQPLARQYFNSLYIALLVTAGTVAVASLSGYAFARIRFPGQNLLFLVLLTGLLLPSEVTIVPLFQLMQRLHWINTHLPLIVVPILGAPSVLATFVMRQFFLSLPGELEEAGRVDGLGRLGLFWYIAMPLARPAVAAVSIFTFLNSWNLFLEPLVYISDRNLLTLPVGLTMYTDAYGTPIWNVQLAATSLTVLPVLLVFLLAQRQFIQGIAWAGLKG